MASKFRQRYRARMERQRGIFIAANRPRLSVSPARIFVAPRVRTLLQELEDRREWHPEGASRPARGLASPRHRLRWVARASERGTSGGVSRGFLDVSMSSVPIGVGFVAPKQVAICIRRKQRREVIHALGKAGRGVRRRKPTRNFYSEVIC